MDGLEKQKLLEASGVDSKLYKEAMAAKPKFSSNEEAIAQLSQELESLAKRKGLSISALLKCAETSTKYDEDEERAASLARRIAFLKK